MVKFEIMSKSQHFLLKPIEKLYQFSLMADMYIGYSIESKVKKMYIISKKYVHAYFGTTLLQHILGAL